MKIRVSGVLLGFMPALRSDEVPGKVGFRVDSVLTKWVSAYIRSLWRFPTALVGFRVPPGGLPCTRKWAPA